MGLDQRKINPGLLFISLPRILYGKALLSIFIYGGERVSTGIVKFWLRVGVDRMAPLSSRSGF